ncbi:hypothetical protein O0550_18435 [Brevibacillus halotolerans]|uniref:hypothetical protein n=1 Tax=Brevibacillus TaxID=55080 RepID=UPI00215CC93F|nr:MULTISPECIES: hypothetical protein [Brevibacillus]MCR8965154.1 hypothetical protein [Brevibacillus laterosporus]MCZ0837309.1 hypothetical protein [Brevibacillus halotolerans]
MKFSIDDIESVVSSGKAVMAAENGIIIAAVQNAVREGRTATFYLTHAQYKAVNSWYWTPRRIRDSGLEQVSEEEKARIQSELRMSNLTLTTPTMLSASVGRCMVHLSSYSRDSMNMVDARLYNRSSI